MTNENIDSLIEDANRALRSGQTDAALHAYESIVRARHDDVVAHRALARLYSEAGRPEQAIEHWLTVKQLRPDIRETTLRLGRLYRDCGMLTHAVGSYEEFQAIDPTHAEPSKVLAQLRAASEPENDVDSSNTPNLLEKQSTTDNRHPAHEPESNTTQHIAVMGNGDAGDDFIFGLLGQLAGVESLETDFAADPLLIGHACVLSRRVPALQLTNAPAAMSTDLVIVFNRPDATCYEPERQLWLNYYTHWLEHEDGHNDIIFVDYQAFIAEPKQHLKRLCINLGLRFDSTALSMMLAVRQPADLASGNTVPHNEITDQETEALYARMVERYRRDFGITDPTITSNIECLLESISGSQTLVASKRRTLLTAACDPERDLKIRLRTLEKSKSKLQQAEVTRNLMERFDFDAYRRMQTLYTCQESIQLHWDFIKYLNLDYWFNSKYQLARKLDLHETASLRILDLGAGPGHFPLACEMLGHKVVGTDIDCTETGNWPHPHLYDALIEFFRLDRRTNRIEALESVPNFGGQFDLITAFMIKFNVVLQNGVLQVWGVQEWDFFLRDIAKNQLTDKGRIFLKMNMTGQDTSSKYVDDSVLEYFKSHGAVIDFTDSTVDFRDVELLRS